MGKLTDEDIEQLLRETFADKENLDDELPLATKPGRRLGPALLAAAAVVAVLAGVLYGVARGTDPEPAPPVATAAATDDGDIWGAVIVDVAQAVQPAQGWTTVQVSGQLTPAIRRENAGRWLAAAKFSALDKERIERAVGVVAPVEWDHSFACGLQRVATVSVGAIHDLGDHKEVSASIIYRCGYVYAATYRVEQASGGWTVTGTAGQPTSFTDLPCLQAASSASPRAGC